MNEAVNTNGIPKTTLKVRISGRVDNGRNHQYVFGEAKRQGVLSKFCNHRKWKDIGREISSYTYIYTCIKVHSI